MSPVSQPSVSRVDPLSAHDNDRPAEGESPEAVAAAFTVEDAHVDLRRYRFEEWLALVLFWGLAGTVFLQFFTRYALNDSAGWTEEIARYLLIATVFIGATIGVRKNSHVQVDFLFHILPSAFKRPLALLVDCVRILFLGYCTVLTWKLIDRIGSSRMSVVDLPMGIVYAFVLLGFGLMTLRALQGALRDHRRGAGVLEKPELLDAENP